jgi:hypothetical protein
MPTADLEAAERVLARLIARAYAADHPELFAAQQETATSGPSPAARADAVAPAARGDGLEELEHGDTDDGDDASQDGSTHALAAA